jgi:hypothetical protein
MEWINEQVNIWKDKRINKEVYKESIKLIKEYNKERQVVNKQINK